MALKFWAHKGGSGKLKDDMRYPVQDNQYRDIYNERDRLRGKRQTVTSKTPNKWMTGIIVVFTWIGLVLGGAFLWQAAMLVRQLMQQGISVQPYFTYVRLLILPPYWWLWLVVYLGPVLTGLAAWEALDRNWHVQNAGRDTRELNTYDNDSRLQQPEELPHRYDIFPGAGAHSAVSPTAVLSHLMLTNKGLKTIEVAKRYPKNTVIKYGDNTEETILKGDVVRDEDGNVVMETKPMIDEEYGESLFDASFIPDDKRLRICYDPRKLLYNPDRARGKQPQDTVADHINADWTFPEYEVQRPEGAYVVDTEPNNTMVLAMTRAGKGQTVIEPTIDMWTRMKNPGNIACNDPKGELYVKFYYPASRRGYDVIAFNLINPTRTNIYNPLGYAVDASRQGNTQKVEEFVNSIGDVFFPTDKADDPMWPNAANAAFKRSALGLIDFYQEEDQEMRLRAAREGWNSSVLNQRLDELWGHVTLYNVYQMMIQLASKKSDDPDIIHIEDDDPSKEKDYLTLFFDATAALPRNSLRTSVNDEDSSLRAMAGSDKTIASVYGISLTAVKFFADIRISRLTSGRPSQNFDMTGLAFPRRFEVRLDFQYMMEHSMRGQRVKWTAYRDSQFTDKYEGKDFEHEGSIDTYGWASYVFKGIFEDHTAYVKLEIFDTTSELLMHTFYFKFIKGFQRSMNGRTYVHDPVTHAKIIRDGVLQEMMPITVKRGDNQQPQIKYVLKQTMVRRERQSLVPEENGKARIDMVPAISQIELHYSEKPKIVFFITPPHLMGYAKIILILLNQMFNMQVDKAYLTKANQKPLYTTRYMLDEVGNLQSEGNGIPFLQTKESIGLGQEQQYTLILQTLQQLKDVYGDSIDKILQGNTGNIIYLKSTDDSMLETLQNMSGTRHEARMDSQTITENARAKFNANDSKLTKTTSIKEVPVISKNDMLLVPKNNSMVFGKGNPIWSRNQLVLPMSWRLLSNQLHELGTSYSLATVPTTANTEEFDVFSNQPNFYDMVAKRCKQARLAAQVTETYKAVYHKDDDGLTRINPDELSAVLMEGINDILHKDDADRDQEMQEELANQQAVDPDDLLNAQEQAAAYQATHKTDGQKLAEAAKPNRETLDAFAQQNRKADAYAAKIYADGRISRSMLKRQGIIQHGDLDKDITKAYLESIGSFQNDHQFRVSKNGSLFLAANDTPLIESAADDTSDAAQAIASMRKASSDRKNKKVRDTPEPQSQDVDQLTDDMRYAVKDDFYEYLLAQDSWTDIANGQFDREMRRQFDNDNGSFND